jgi:hypothetical protein
VITTIKACVSKKRKKLAKHKQERSVASLYLSYYIAKRAWNKLQARAKKKRTNGPGRLVGQKDFRASERRFRVRDGGPIFCLRSVDREQAFSFFFYLSWFVSYKCPFDWLIIVVKERGKEKSSTPSVFMNRATKLVSKLTPRKALLISLFSTRTGQP